MRYRVQHSSTYDYESPVLHARHLIHKRPRSLPYQRVETSSVVSSPRPVWATQEFDHQGNMVDVIELLGSHDQLVVTAISELNIDPRPHDRTRPELCRPWESIRDRLLADAQCFEAWDTTMLSPYVPRVSELERYARGSFTPGRPFFEALEDLNHRIYADFAYDPASTDIATPLARVVEERRGVCQDFAHVFLGALRGLGLSARYVSGYLETVPPAGRSRLVGADASHAWISVYFPDYGWVDFDPTNDLLPQDRHVVVAWGRDFGDVSPIRGAVHGGGQHTVLVSVDVAPIVEDRLSQQQGGAPRFGVGQQQSQNQQQAFGQKNSS